MTTRIGKDVIESLTLAMYEDSRFIYREYIQNAADQIDKAVELKILKDKSEGKIHVQIDKKNHFISIFDNATGVKSDDILPILKNIAKSPKDRSKDRGFRGIGRLGGLAYCARLTFETTYKGEDIKSTMIWDAIRLREILNDRTSHEDASDVIDAIVSIETEPADKDDHFFQVNLYNVSEETLLNEKEIKKYLYMVAPVPYNSVCFRYAQKIYENAKAYSQPIDEYNIYVGTELIKKAYTNYIYSGTDDNKTRTDEILDLVFFDIKDSSSNLLAWGWHGISSFNGVIQEINTARGIRLRKGNIQIGLENCLEKFHKEKRGNSYYIGEIHAVHPDLVPNARRDYFEENQTCNEFNSLISEYFSKLYKYYHFASDIRSNVKQIEKVIELKLEIEEKEKKGYRSIEEKDKLEDSFDNAKEKAKKSESKLSRIITEKKDGETPESDILKSVIKKETDKMIDHYSSNGKTALNFVKKIPELLSNGNGTSGHKATLEIDNISVKTNGEKTNLISDELNLNPSQRKLFNKIINILDNILPSDYSKVVTQKLIEELK